MASLNSGVLRVPPNDWERHVESILWVFRQPLGYKTLSPTPSQKPLLDEYQN